MTNLKILIGDGRAGKTTYANKVVKEGYEFISIMIYGVKNGERKNA